MRLPRDFAEMLKAFKPEQRQVVLWLSLEGRIGSVWNLPKLAESSAQIRRVGVLLNQVLRYLGQGGTDTDRLVAAVHLTMREIKKLRPPNYEEDVPEIPLGKTAGGKTENPSKNAEPASAQTNGTADGKAGE
jgi:hypothetical protein